MTTEKLEAVARIVDSISFDQVARWTEPNFNVSSANIAAARDGVEAALSKARDIHALYASEIARLTAALEAYLAIHTSVTADLHTAHQLRGGGASQWMREDDAELRRDFARAGDLARSALSPSSEGGSSSERRGDSQTAERLRELRRFLNGEAALDGVFFGESHPALRGPYWWRGFLNTLERAAEMLTTPNPPSAGEALRKDEA